jgi:hypothetical protein
MPDFCRVGSYWCQVYATAAIGCGLPLVYFMRLSLAERRKRGFIQPCVAAIPGAVRSELVTFLIWPIVCGWKARRNI